MMPAPRVHPDQAALPRRRPLNRHILAATLTVGSLTFVAKLGIAAKDLVTAYYFGTSDDLDAFLIALLIPTFAVNVIAGPFQAAFVPAYVQVRERDGSEAARRLFSSIAVCGTLLLVVVSALLAVAAPYALPVLASGFGASKLELTRLLLLSLLPVPLLGGAAALWTTLLNAAGRFAVAAIVPVVTPVATILAVLLASESWGVFALVAGTLGGLLLEGVMLLRELARQGLPVLPRWYGMAPALRHAISQYAPMVAGGVMMTSTGLVDQSMAAMLGSGSVSALSYGGKVIGFALAVGATALGTVVFPHYSRMVAVGDWDGVREAIRSHGRLILLVTVPATGALVLLSEPLVRLLFGRGAFSEADVHLVARVQALYALQVPFYMLGILGVRVLSAMKKNEILMVISLVNVILNVVGNYVLIQVLGLEGISLSTSIVYAVSTSLVFLALRGQIRRQGRPYGQDGWCGAGA